MLAATAFFLAATPGRPSRAAAQEHRPVLLIGGTLVPRGFIGSSFRLPPTGVLVNIEGWQFLTSDFFVGELGYQPDQIRTAELARQDIEPPNWRNRPALYRLYTWASVKSTLENNFLSTAGLGPIWQSVENVALEIRQLLLDTGAAQIDVIGHSQGGVVARAAIRHGVEQGYFTADRVRKVISLGGVHYGIPTVTPEALGSFGFLGSVVGWFTAAFLGDCRDGGLIPVCTDIVRDGFSATRGLVNVAAEQTLENPFGYQSPPLIGRVNFSYITGASFYPYFNVSSSIMVFGPTRYTHIYSRNYDGGTVSATEAVIPERHRLPTQYGNVTNINVQDYCKAEKDKNPAFETPGLALRVHHNLEWQDPTVRTLIARELGFAYRHDDYCKDTIY